MKKFDIETYLNSLPENVTNIDISSRNLTKLSSLTRFTNLRTLDCEHNKLTSLPEELPESLEQLYCSYNQLTSLPRRLPTRLQYLYCMNNRLTSLPEELPESLRHLYCTGNQLTSLPPLHSNIINLYCNHNPLTFIPTLPESISGFSFDFTPIWKIINSSDFVIIKQKIKLLNSLRHLCYCLKFKHQFRKWLWERVRKPKIERKYNPMYLISNLNEDIDLDRFLGHWITSA